MIKSLKKRVLDFFEGSFNALMMLLYIIPKIILGRTRINDGVIYVIYPDTSKVKLVIGKSYLDAGAVNGVSGGTMAADDFKRFERKMFLED